MTVVMVLLPLLLAAAFVSASARPEGADLQAADARISPFAQEEAQALSPEERERRAVEWAVAESEERVKRSPQRRPRPPPGRPRPRPGPPPRPPSPPIPRPRGRG